MPSENSDTAGRLQRRLAATEALVGIIGLGYVGLPLALTFAEAGHRVLGFDVDGDKVTTLGAGGSYIPHLDAARVERARAAGRFAATADMARLAEPDVLLICIPTPLTEDRRPDLSYVEATVGSIAAVLRPGQLVVLESTTYPGTTEEVVLPMLAASGLACGRDFFLAYSPEREDPGNLRFSTGSIPKVVGGVDGTSADLAAQLYGAIVPQVVRVSSTAVAEATKLTENVFRAVNIALVNELKMVYDRLGIDIWEVLDAAETKPFGFMRFDPGPGWGGHCIPIDPFYLAWKAARVGAPARFIELAGIINQEVTRYVVSRLEAELAVRSHALAGSAVLLLGLSYKRNVGDSRESPALVLYDELERGGASVSFHDPFIAAIPRTRSWPHLEGVRGVELSADRLAAADAVVVVTDHEVIDWSLVARHARLVIDTRGVLERDGLRVVPA